MAQRPSRRQRVVQRAGYRCEYCGYPEEASPIPLEVDHIIFQKKIIPGQPTNHAE